LDTPSYKKLKYTTSPSGQKYERESRTWLYHISEFITFKQQTFDVKYEDDSKEGNVIIYSKIKVKLSLCCTKYHTMKTLRRVEVQLHTFLNSALDGGNWSASRFRRFNQGGGKERGTHGIGGWGAIEPVWTQWPREKNPSPCRESKPQ
jgi:hypothetical protein